MVGKLGAQLGLLAFAFGLLAGIAVGNPPTTVLTRALLIMVMAVFLGQFVGWAGKLVLRDHLQRRKFEIDRAHQEATAAASATDEPAPATTES